MQDEFKGQHGFSCSRTEISSSRFYAVELNLNFGLSSSIQSSLTGELNGEEFKLVCPKLLILCYQVS